MQFRSKFDREETHDDQNRNRHWNIKVHEYSSALKKIEFGRKYCWGYMDKITPIVLWVSNNRMKIHVHTIDVSLYRKLAVIENHEIAQHAKYYFQPDALLLRSGGGDLSC